MPPSALPTIGADRPSLRPDLADVARALHHKYDDVHGEQAVSDCLDAVAARFEQARVRAFVPLLVQRYASELLAATEPAAEPALPEVAIA